MAMKKGLRSRIRTLPCPLLEPEEGTSQDRKFLQQCYAQGFDSAICLVLDYMDRYTPLPKMLFDRVQELRTRRLDDIHGDGQPGTIISNAGFLFACGRTLKLIWEKHGEEIEWMRAIERAEKAESL